jgi:hypothetical protein
VMSYGVLHIDLPKTREPMPDFFVRQNPDAERRLEFDILVESDLGAGQQADRDMRLADSGETAGDGVIEFG